MRLMFIGAILYAADLRKSDLTYADLRHANLQKANLVRADLCGAKYDTKTKWREGFDPVAAGARLME